MFVSRDRFHRRMRHAITADLDTGPDTDVSSEPCDDDDYFIAGRRTNATTRR